MFRKIADNIASFLFHTKIIMEDEKELYSYAAYNIIFRTALILLLIVLSLIMDKVIENIIIICTFLTIRKYSGGLHFNSSIVCFSFSTLIMVVLLLFSGYITSMSWIILLVSSILITYVSPMDSTKKKNDVSEVLEYKKKCSIILFVFFLLYSFMIMFNRILYANCIFLGVELVFFLQVIEILKRVTKL